MAPPRARRHTGPLPRARRAIATEAPKWRDGHSEYFVRKWLPIRLLERYDAVLNDPALPSVRQYMALTGVRLSELLEKLPTFESGAAWRAIGEILIQLEGLATDPAPTPATFARITKLLGAMRQQYQQARHEANLWDEIHGVMERGRRLAQTEQEREHALQASLSAAQAIALLNGIVQLHVQLIPDAQVRYQLGAGLLALLQRESPEVLPELPAPRERRPAAR